MKQLNNEDFWSWFSDNSKMFFKVVASQKDVSGAFVNPVSVKLNALRSGYYILAGMYDDDVAELIITADGDVRVIPFIEELVANAPEIAHWRFTALKPPSDREDFTVDFSQASLSADTLHFIFKEEKDYPDLINIDIVHQGINGTNRRLFEQGIFIFLENYIGELQCLERIDAIAIKANYEATGELIPMGKLDSFLKWRHKEQIEKYDQMKRTSDTDQCTGFESKTESGTTLISTINTDLLNWEHIAGYPWQTILSIEYKEGNNGMPDQKDYKSLESIEDAVNLLLSEDLFCLNIGRRTGGSKREIYYASKDFRLPAKVMDELVNSNYPFTISFEIFKDKYWQTFNEFKVF